MYQIPPTIKRFIEKHKVKELEEIRKEKEEARKETREEHIKEIAMRMYRNGFSAEEIMKATGLTEQDMKDIKNSL